MLSACRLLSPAGVATAALLRNAASLRRLRLHDDDDTGGAAAVFDELFGLGQEAERLLQPSSGTTGAPSAVPSGATALHGLRELEISALFLREAGLAALGRGLRSSVGAALEALTVEHVRLVDVSRQGRSAIACDVADALLANIVAAGSRLRVLTLVDVGTADEGAVPSADTFSDGRQRWGSRARVR